MIMIAPTIRTAEPHEAAPIGDLLADAFQEPVTHWLVPDPVDRPQIMAKFFALVAEDALGAGTVHVAGDYEGAALWFDMTQHAPEPTEPDPRYAAIFGQYAARWNTVDNLMTSNHPDAAPHHYLMIVGVRQARQGQGLGRALIEHHHRTVVDAAGLPAYLEATSPGSRRLYRKLGYQDLRAPLQIPDGPKMFPMWRPVGGTGELPVLN
jgi:GNAT superfamily N-acetyltransferase